MWPWKRQPSNLALEERIESLERRFKTLSMETEDFFDSVRRAENRIKEKRAKLEPHDTNGEGEVAPEAAEALSPYTGLTPRQKQLQQMVLRRRANL